MRAETSSRTRDRQGRKNLIWAESEPDKGATFYLTIGDIPIPIVPTTE